MKNIINVENLTKNFSYYKKEEGLKGTFKALFKRKKLQKTAVNNISFSIDKGEFIGFLGPNGAGKTTTLKMLSGILTPTNGSIIIDGHTPHMRQDEFKKKISIVMGQKAQLWLTLPAIESYNLFQKIYEIPETKYRKIIKSFSEILDISDLLNVQVRKLSLGQRMKCELLASLLHSPKILFLDEPTIGLDLISQKKIREFLQKYNEEQKTTIILTSHNMDDVQQVCKRLIIINEGQIGYDGTIDEIVKKYSTDKNIHVIFSQKVLKKDLQNIGKIHEFNPYEAKISIPIAIATKNIGKLISKYPVKDINIKDITLDEIVTHLFNK